MDLYNTVQFRKEINGNLYVFTMPSTAPLGEAYDVLHEALRHIVKVSQDNVQRMVRQAAEESTAKSDYAEIKTEQVVQ